MKLPIKQKYFKAIKMGVKNFEFRDAHITFVCEETGETLIKDVVGVKIVNKQDMFSKLFEDGTLIEFELSKRTSHAKLHNETIELVEKSPKDPRSRKNVLMKCEHCGEIKTRIHTCSLT